jgi:hypothetical protein
MSSAAESKLAELRQTVSELRAGVASLEKSRDREQCRVLGERITQALLAVDGVDASKAAAAQAFRERDRKSAMAIAVLVTRRKAVVKELHALGERVDSITAEIELGSAKGKGEERDVRPSGDDPGGDDEEEDDDDDDAEEDSRDGEEGEQSKTKVDDRNK